MKKRFFKNKTLPAVILLLFIPAFLLREALFYGYTLWPAEYIFVLFPWKAFPPEGYNGPYNQFLFDNIFVFYPWFNIVSDVIRNGSLPLWNPYISCGWPIFANSLGFFFPLNMVFYILPVWYAFGIVAALKIFFAGFFTYLYARSLLLDSFSSLVSAIAFMLSAFMIGWLGHPQTNIAILLPLFFLLTNEFVKKGYGPDARRGLLYPSLLALTTGAAFFGGHYETAFHVLSATLLYFLFCIFYHRPKKPFLTCVAYASSLIFGILVAAVQLIPAWEYIKQSSVYISRGEYSGASFAAFYATLKGLVTLFVPDFYGNPVDRNDWGGYAGLSSYIEQSGYIGMASLFLAFFAVTGLYKNGKVVFFAALSALSLAVVNRMPFLTDFINALPVFSKLANNRIILVWCFSGAMLAGYGAKYLTELQPKKRIQLSLLLVSSILFAFALWYTTAYGSFSKVVAMYNMKDYLSDKIWLFLVFSFITVATVFLYTERLINKMLFEGLIITALLTDLILFAGKVWPSNDPKLLFPSTPAIEFLKKDKEVFRTYGVENVMSINTWTPYALQDIRGYDGITLRDYEEFITGRTGDGIFFMHAPYIPRHIDLMNVKYVLTPPGMTVNRGDFKRVFSGEIDIYLNEGYLPRAFVAYDAITIRNKNETLNYVYGASFDPSKEVTLDSDPPQWFHPIVRPPIPAGIVRYEPNEVTVEAATPSPGMLVLSDTFYPGWKAYVDGAQTPIYRADYMFRAVALREGKHIVKFRYEPESFRIGALLSLLAAGAAAVVLASAFIGQRKERR